MCVILQYDPTGVSFIGFVYMTAYQGCASPMVDKSAGSRFPVSRGCAPLPDWRTVRATGFAAQNMLILSECFRSSLRVEVSNSDFMLSLEMSWGCRDIEKMAPYRRQHKDRSIRWFDHPILHRGKPILLAGGTARSWGLSISVTVPWPSMAIPGHPWGVAGVSWCQTRNRPGWDGDYLSADETCAAGSLKGCLDVGALCGGWNYPQPQPWTFGVGRKSRCRQARW